jgi:hypothetical protein
MKKLFTITMFVASTLASYSQGVTANSPRTIPMLVTAREHEAVEADRVRQMQYAAIREIQKVTDTNKIAAITAEIIAAQPKTNGPALNRQPAAQTQTSP